MQNKLIHFILLLLVALQVCCAQDTHRVSTTATIVSSSGEPIAGASILISYPQYRTGEYINDRGTTDENGQFSFTGQALEKYLVRVEKDGYYEIYYESEVYRYDHELQKKQYIDTDVTLTLREIKNPIPMYAIARPEIKVPEYGKKIGFDLEKADWVAPYGKGKSADVLFQADGYYNERRDYDLTLTLSFPNEGDGFIAFQANERKGSKLRSPHQAPLDGYIAEKKWRSRLVPTDKPVAHGVKFDGTRDYEKNLNYILRVQTVLDENGDVVQAKYAKIYDDLKFWGVRPDGNQVGILVEKYYFNPTTNDRSLEFKVGQNLFKNLRSTQDPKLP